MKLTTDPRVPIVFEQYPDQVKNQMNQLRTLILEAATEVDGLDQLEETLKWGEPSYLAKQGSTVRIDWKKKTPDQYAVYFKCTSKLVETFQTVFNDLFQYEGKRAIVFKLDDEIPMTPLKQCLTAALTYHKVKKLPLLGIV